MLGKLLVSFFICLVSFSGVGSEPSSEDAVDLAQIKMDIEKIREKVVASDSQKREAMRSVFEVTQKIHKISKEKGKLTDRLLLLKMEAKGVAKEIVGLEKKIGEQKILMSKRLGALYKLSGQSFFRLIFSVSSTKNLERNLRFLSLVAERDLKVIKQYRSSVDNLNERKEDLSNKVAQIVGVKKRIKTKEDLLLSEQREQAKIVESISDQRQKDLSKIKSLRAKVDEETVVSQYFFEKKGKLLPPIANKIVSEFGLVEGENKGVWLSHKGLRFSREGSDRALAVDRALVQFIGAIDGYGNVVILDHGENYYSVYGHLDKILVKPGQQVESRAPIAVLSADKNKNEGLYFEIRHFSQPEDPQPWIAGREITVSAVE